MAIEWAVSDLDDTHIFTHRHFKEKIALCIQHICAAENPQLISQVHTRFSEISDAAFLIPGISVSPDRWKYVLETLSQIYTTVPQLREDSIFALEHYRQSNLKIAIFSHAPLGIIEFKLQQTGIDKFIDQVGAVNPLSHKDGNAWHTFITQQIGIDTHQVIAIGDSITSNIKAAFETGVPVNQIIWYDARDGMPSAKKGLLPPGVHQITSHFQLPDVLP